MSEETSINIDLAKIREGGIFVATPMYGGQCTGSFCKSMINLTVLCAQHGIPIKTHFLYNESLVQRARNYCVDEFLRSGMKQMIFIDADIEFTAIDVLVLAHLQNQNTDYNVICGVYPKKSINWKKVAGAVEKGVADEEPNILENFVGDYVFNVLSGTESIKLSEPVEVYESGTGFMLIHRETYLRLREALPETSYKPDHIGQDHFDGSREINAYFDCIIDPVSKRYLSEDYLFCHRVRDAGMKVWIAPWIKLKHAGHYVFGGSLAALASIKK